MTKRKAALFVGDKSMGMVEVEDPIGVDFAKAVQQSMAKSIERQVTAQFEAPPEHAKMWNELFGPPARPRRQLTPITVTLEPQGLRDPSEREPPDQPGKVYPPTLVELEKLRLAFTELALAPMHGIRGVSVQLGQLSTVTVEVEAFHRATAAPISLTFTRAFSPLEVLGFAHPLGASMLVRQALHAALTHEADECLRFADGRICFDPHAPSVEFTIRSSNDRSTR